MDIECCEKLLEPNPTQLAVKRNTWNLLSLDIQLDVYRCLRAYDLYKKGVNVSRQWRNTIERHKGMLPKFRQLTDCRALNKLAGDSYDEYFRRQEEETRRNVKLVLQQRRRKRNHINTYTILSIIGFIAVMMAQLGHISVERTVAMILLLTVTLHMGNAYENLLYYYGGNYCCLFKRISDLWYDQKKSFGYILPVYLAIRDVLFISIAILNHLIQADNILDMFLWGLYFPEAIYLLNWSIYECGCRYWFPSSGMVSRYRRNIEWLKPDYAGTDWHSKWYSEMPIHTNFNRPIEQPTSPILTETKCVFV
ncbi:hypothetical protein Ddc_14667 [Ditylenchus destructor]|nr:hypothetical protein Ddc_14667 [Ditylenchus destructor]